MKSKIKIFYTLCCISLFLFLLLILFPHIRESTSVAGKIAISLPFFAIVTYSLIYAVIHAVKKIRERTIDDISSLKTLGNKLDK